MRKAQRLDRFSVQHLRFLLIPRKCHFLIPKLLGYSIALSSTFIMFGSWSFSFEGNGTSQLYYQFHWRNLQMTFGWILFTSVPCCRAEMWPLTKLKEKLNELCRNSKSSLSHMDTLTIFSKVPSRLGSFCGLIGVFRSPDSDGQQGHFSSRVRQKPIYFFFSLKTNKSQDYPVFYLGTLICCAGSIYWQTSKGFYEWVPRVILFHG